MKDDMLSNLELENKIEKWSEPEKFIARDLHYLHRKMDKISDTQDDIGQRVTNVENNCKQAICDRMTGKTILTPNVKKAAAVGGLPAVVGIIYGIVELVRMLRGG